MLEHMSVFLCVSMCAYMFICVQVHVCMPMRLEVDTGYLPQLHSLHVNLYMYVCRYVCGKLCVCVLAHMYRCQKSFLIAICLIHLGKVTHLNPELNGMSVLANWLASISTFQALELHVGQHAHAR